MSGTKFGERWLKQGPGGTIRKKNKTSWEASDFVMEKCVKMCGFETGEGGELRVLAYQE